MLIEPFEVEGLAILCRSLDDVEKTRVATGNRIRILTLPTDQVDEKDGKTRGFGLTEDDPVVKVQHKVMVSLLVAEEDLVGSVKRIIRREHPLGPWIADQKGVGERQAGRLLAAIGDPYWNDLHDRPRTVGELWAFCGLVPGLKRTKGEKANWSRVAKMRTWLVVQSIIKTKGPWRDLWDEAREHYRDRLHTEPCTRCTGKGQPPAPVGSPWKDAHAKGATDRYVGKRLLRELWRESRRLHGVEDDLDGLIPYAA